MHDCLGLLTQHRTLLQRSDIDNEEAAKLTERTIAIRRNMLNIFDAEPEGLLKNMQEILSIIGNSNVGEGQVHFDNSFKLAESSFTYAQDYWKTKVLKNEAYWKALVTPDNEIW